MPPPPSLQLGATFPARLAAGAGGWAVLEPLPGQPEPVPPADRAWDAPKAVLSTRGVGTLQPGAPVLPEVGGVGGEGGGGASRDTASAAGEIRQTPAEGLPPTQGPPGRLYRPGGAAQNPRVVGTGASHGAAAAAPRAPEPFARRG